MLPDANTIGLGLLVVSHMMWVGLFLRERWRLVQLNEQFKGLVGSGAALTQMAQDFLDDMTEALASVYGTTIQELMDALDDHRRKNNDRAPSNS